MATPTQAERYRASVDAGSLILMTTGVAEGWAGERAMLVAAIGLACHAGGNIGQTIELAQQLCRTVYGSRAVAIAGSEAAARKILAERAARSESADAAG